MQRTYTKEEIKTMINQEIVAFEDIYKSGIGCASTTAPAINKLFY